MLRFNSKSAFVRNEKQPPSIIVMTSSGHDEQKALEASNRRFKLLAHLVDRLSGYFPIQRIEIAGLTTGRESFFVHFDNEKRLPYREQCAILHVTEDPRVFNLMFRLQKYVIRDPSDIDKVFPPGKSVQERLEVNEETWAERVLQEKSERRNMKGRPLPN